MNKILGIIVLLFSITIHSQNTKHSDEFQNVVGNMKIAGMWIPSYKADQSIEGSVYLFSNWEQLFDIELTNKMNIRLYNLNYNIQQKTLESKISNDSVYQFEINNFDRIKLINNTYKVNNGSLYQEIFAGNKIKCYKGFIISTTPGVFNPLTQTMSSQAKYVRNETYYYMLNEQMVEFKRSKKNLLKIFSDKKEIIESEIKKKKYDFDNDDDLRQLFQFYDSL
ncbi:hypothetical protein [Flavobacterium capsici]|uniref:Uncharacterized protein n=1 Tax=Flavobacterium capsici TaxID=3075618 RepID=A0AA96F2M3_9FLAO|nr:MULTISPECIES: hypothetical protein [unclassified Flavobacterium]WNM20167.1 hypothetical protein RN608_05675 [Flavobacterium sp. PMR2A8]WNM21557.1 hypothetical protein RN605_12845 [Flavobacterium sp. PMTSA4]